MYQLIVKAYLSFSVVCSATLPLPTPFAFLDIDSVICIARLTFLLCVLAFWAHFMCFAWLTSVRVLRDTYGQVVGRVESKVKF